MESRLIACLVGFGRAGHFHYQSVTNLAHLSLKYIVDPDQSVKRDIPQSITLLDDLQTALDDEAVDLMIVASPTGYHHEQIMRSLEAGKHVFAEKPVGKTVKEITECYDMAEARGLCFHLGFQRRYDTNFKHLKEQLHAVGQPRIVRTSSRDNPKPSLAYLSLSGNIFHDMLIHDFDMLMFLFGPRKPKTIFSLAKAHDKDIGNLEDYDTVLVSLEYPDGLICTIDTSRTSIYGYDQRIEIFGENGMLQAENEVENTVKLLDDKGIHTSRVMHSFPQRYRHCYKREIEHFFKQINGGDQFNVTRKECLIAHLIADAAHQSVQSGKPVDFHSFYERGLT